MSLATRCTHCGTIFKVVQDQLKVSEGWVRCGRCHEVFNALPALFDLDSEAPPPRRTAPPPPPAPVEPEPAPEDETPPWTTTRPTELAPPTPISAHTPLSAADLHLAATPLPAATDFELDTAVHLPLSEPRPWDGPPPQDVPDTDESDALDSRYLMPSQDGPRQVKRRPQGPEFADAQFPNDAMLDAENDWAQGSIPAELPPEPAPPAPPAPKAPAPPPSRSLPSAATTPVPLPTAAPLPSASLLRSPSGTSPGPGSATTARTADAEDDPSIPTTLPSRFGEDFVREQVQPPPSKRQGRSGTRGRDPAT
ncbi:MAG: zinc-ribbon domain-containing protein, partial [Aquabacterium commune]|uniref:zinc-ribbon domain-containing protein n=1 Tax=Aquabacterium commune TaxID=70586 RepID=UPI003BAE8736